MSQVEAPRKVAVPGASPAGFQQRLGLFDATMLVAGTMIGSGIFIVSADIARDVGSTGWLLAIWVLTGVMTIFGALSYAELASMMPHAGGQYVYLREAYSPLWGFLYGWTVFLVIQTGSIAAVGVAFAKYLGVLVPQLGTDNLLYRVPVNIDLPIPVPWHPDKQVSVFKRTEFTISAGQLVGVVVVVFLTLLNCRGVREGKWVQNLFTVAKTLALIVLIVLGLTVAANPKALQENFADLWAGMTDTDKFKEVRKFMPLVPLAALMVAGGAMVGALFSADAWNNVTFTAGEVRHPRRNLPLSLLLGTGMVILLYLLANGAYVAALPVRGDAELAARLQAEYQNALADAGEVAAGQQVLEAQAAKLKSEAALQELAAADLRKQGKGEEADEVTVVAQAKTVQAVALRVGADFLADRYRQAVAEAKKQSEAKYAANTFELGIDHAKDDRVGTAALQLASPKFGVPFMALAIMVSTFGCVNGMILMGGRLYYAMARDGLFFRSVGELNPKGVPAAGLILQGVWSVLLVFSGSYNELLDYVIFAALLFYVLTVVGLFILRRKQPRAERPYRAWGYPVVPAIYVVLCAVIMIDLLVVKPTLSWPSFLIILSGIPVYFYWRFLGRRRPTEPAFPD